MANYTYADYLSKSVNFQVFNIGEWSCPILAVVVQAPIGKTSDDEVLFNDIAFFSLCRVQIDVSTSEQKAQLSYCFLI